MTQDMHRIRVENQPGIQVSRFASLANDGTGLLDAVRPFRILFIKPYQQARDTVYGPPLGILTLIAILRQHFGHKADIRFRDMKLYNETPEQILPLLGEWQPDVLAISALNCETRSTVELIDHVKAALPQCITLIGGPVTLRQSAMLFQDSAVDWIFEGAADRTLPQALARQFSDTPLGNDLPGFSHRNAQGRISENTRQDLITDMDELPMPAWDLVDFDRYSKRDRPRIITNVGNRKYAYIFTSRGCPYLCNYCHDLFTKRFVYRSVDSVIEEIRLLHEDYGVSEFHFIDDIFNLHKPRVQAIMAEIEKRWPGELYLAYPNGLRGDILDQATIDAMVRAGTYHVSISIETVTPRLQDLAEKYLDIDKALWAINEFSRQGVIVLGNFMLGFPTETVDEIEHSIRFAVDSQLTHAYFFSVTPQPGTPIYELAQQACPQATQRRARDERDVGDYSGFEPWYTHAYGYNLHRKITTAYLRFYLKPRRFLHLVRNYNMKNLVIGGSLMIVRATRVMLHNVLRRLSPARRPAGEAGIREPH